MLDINLIRENTEVVREALRKRQMETAVLDDILALDKQRRQLIQESEALKAERNKVSKEIGKMKDQSSRALKIEEMRAVGQKISKLDEQLREVEANLHSIMATLPNIPDERVPVGVDESENVVVKTVGVLPEFDFQPQPHWDIGPNLGIIDFERGVKITGSRFYVLTGAGARLQRALISWMLDLHYTPCFRREKMSAGRDVRGIKRGHQFDKVEMYIYCKPEDSDDAFNKMMADAEAVCEGLGLPYRVVQLCTGDLGFGASFTYDIEVWAAGSGEWLEVSSVSKVTDFQARRANIRYRPSGGGKPRFLHTLNGSGLGLPRTLIAVLENYQQADGSVVIPEVLRPWMGGIDVIRPPEK